MRKLLLIAMLIFSFGCGKKEDKNTLKIAASAIPHAQMLNFVKPFLASQGIALKIIEVDDYNIPNRSLAEKEIDANFFQHIPFMEAQIENFGYKIECYARIHLEPMAVYSRKIKSLKELTDGAMVALPNDPTNEFRALSILADQGLITLKKDSNLQATVANIESNPKRLRFKEIDAALLPRTLPDVDLAVIPTNYALQAQLNPTKDALAIESNDSPYANILTVRTGDTSDPKLEALKKVMLSDKMRQFIIEQYKGAILPVLKECSSDKN